MRFLYLQTFESFNVLKFEAKNTWGQLVAGACSEFNRWVRTLFLFSFQKMRILAAVTYNSEASLKPLVL